MVAVSLRLADVRQRRADALPRALVEFLEAFGTDEWIASENEPTAVDAVRRKLVTPYEARPFHRNKTDGVFEGLRPWFIVETLTGWADASADDGAQRDAIHSREYFTRLGADVTCYVDAFLARRRAAKRGQKRHLPEELELRDVFGDDWEIVRDCWPAARFLAPLLTLRWRPPPAGVKVLERRFAYQQEARGILARLSERPLVVDELRKFTAPRVRGVRGNRRYLETSDLVSAALDYDGALKSVFLYEPTGDPRMAVEYWLASAKNRARDAASRPVMLGHGPDGPVGRARSTLRNWKRTGRAERDTLGKLVTPLALIASENDAQRRHRDPLRRTLTATELAAKLGCPPRTARKAVRSAIDAGAIVERRLPSSRNRVGIRGPGAAHPGSYALTAADVELVRRFVPARRSPKGVFTAKKAARELRVSVEDLVDALADLKGVGAEHLDDMSEVEPCEFESLQRIFHRRR